MTTTTPLREPAWSAKKYILGALVAAGVMVAVATAISISLAPAHISFSVAYYGFMLPVDASGQLLYKWFGNLTLVAHDNSRRREVYYGSIAADIWWSETASVPNDEAEPPSWQLPGSAPRFNLSVEGGHYDEKDNAAAPPPAASAAAQTPPADNTGGRNMSRVEWPNCRVVVEAKVRFRFARIPTLPYTVTATCFPVNFTAGPVSVDCTS